MFLLPVMYLNKNVKIPGMVSTLPTLREARTPNGGEISITFNSDKVQQHAVPG
jgi:hypothetical protein